MAKVYWVTRIGSGRLGLLPHPRGDGLLTGELRALRDDGLDRLVSLLTPSEARRYGLGQEASACAAAGITFESFPIEDRDVPDEREPAIAFLGELIAHLHRGENVAVHCLAGVGRSGLMTASLLVLTGIPPDEAIDLVAEGRQHSIPDTSAQRKWIQEIGEVWKARHIF